MQAVLKKKREKKLKSIVPAPSKEENLIMQAARAQAQVTSATSSSATTSRGGSNGGLQIFAQKRPAPVGEGQEAAEVGADFRSDGSVKKRSRESTSQDVPALHVSNSKRKKKKKRAV